jgi:LmbE family N-acetylglucosaminyl deacetylase
MNVLIISVHPDDETLGCGGTMLKHRANGDDVRWLILTSAREPLWSKEVIETKAREVAAVAEAYDIPAPYRANLPAGQLDRVPQEEILFAVRDAVRDAKPEVVYLVHGGDVNSDHRAAFTGALSALKPFHLLALGVKRVLCYETLSSTEAAPQLIQNAFLPQVCSDITPWIDRKIEIMALYSSETHPDPMPRGPSAIRARARSRGSAFALDYAEAFSLIWQVE